MSPNCEENNQPRPHPQPHHLQDQKRQSRLKKERKLAQLKLTKIILILTQLNM
jgi:hypothetical protein